MKVDKSDTCEMQHILDKCKFEQIQTFEQIKKLKKSFLNAQQMSIQ